MVKHGLYTGHQRFAIYNNTICNSATRSEVFFNEKPGTGSTYKNNIVYNDNYNSLVRFNSTALPSSLEMDYDNYNVVTPDSLIFGIAQTNTKYTLSQVQNIYNRELNSFVANPCFVDALNKDYHLSANSPCIDAGGFLTKTTSSGTGTQIPVEDIIYFCDGYGIVGGDTIQLQGQTQKVVITNIDTANNIITVDRNISWNQGDGVALSFNGTAPDIGAYEYNSPVGIAKSSLKNNLMVFPNPATGKITVRIPEKQFYKGWAVLSDIKGNPVLKIPMENSLQKYDLSFLPRGVYIIKITCGEFTDTEKIVLY